MLEDALADLLEGPGPGIEFHAGIAVALYPALDDQKEINPHGLGAGIAAPRATDRGRDEKQTETGHNEEPGHEKELLRPDLDEEEIEAPVGEVHEHRLVRSIGTAIPADPWRQVVDAERDEHHQPLEATETSFRPLRKDLLSRLVKRLRGVASVSVCCLMAVTGRVDVLCGVEIHGTFPPLCLPFPIWAGKYP